MFYNMTLAVKNRLIEEFKRYWGDHPRYPELAQNIQGKFSFDERPQLGMIIKTGGVSNVSLSQNNFIGTIRGRVYLSQTPKRSSTTIEWVKEDQGNYGNNPEVGIFFITIEAKGNIEGYYGMRIHKYLRVIDNNPMFSAPTTIQLTSTPIETSLRVIEFPQGKILVKDTDYTFNPDTLEIELTIDEVDLAPRYQVVYTEDSGEKGLFDFKADRAYHNFIPGIVLAVGRRVRVGDEMYVVVTENPEDVAHEYGGRLDVSVDIEIIARDVHTQADICDHCLIWIWSNLREKFGSIGMAISDVSFGGDSEEVYDDNGDDYFYGGSISMTIQTDWFVHFPLVIPVLAVDTAGILPVNTLPVGPLAGYGSELRERIL